MIEPVHDVIPREKLKGNLVIRSIRPDDDFNSLWNLSVRALSPLGFSTRRNPIHEDFDDLYGYYVNKRGDFIVAEVGRRIVGFCGFIQHPDAGLVDTCNMRRLRVDPEFQGIGIGQRLIEEREKRAIQMGYKTARLGTSNKNLAAFNLLLKNNYRVISTTPKPDEGLGEDYVVYQLEKKLTND